MELRETLFSLMTTFTFSVNEGYLQKEEAKRETEGGGKRVMTVKKLL